MTNDLYKTKYKTAESRAFHLIAQKKYGSFTKMAESLGVSRQYINQCVDLGVPLKYASYLGRKHLFSPGVLAYKDWCLLLCKNDTGCGYDKLVQDARMFDDKDVEYILKGTYKSPESLIKESDACIG
jgi:hypothetical protein